MIVGGFAQFLPVADNPLYHSILSGNAVLIGYLGYRSVTIVVKLTKNGPGIVTTKFMS